MRASRVRAGTTKETPLTSTLKHKEQVRTYELESRGPQEGIHLHTRLVTRQGPRADNVHNRTDLAHHGGEAQMHLVVTRSHGGRYAQCGVKHEGIIQLAHAALDGDVVRGLDMWGRWRVSIAQRFVCRRWNIWDIIRLSAADQTRHTYAEQTLTTVASGLDDADKTDLGWSCGMIIWV